MRNTIEGLLSSTIQIEDCLDPLHVELLAIFVQVLLLGNWTWWIGLLAWIQVGLIIVEITDVFPSQSLLIWICAICWIGWNALVYLGSTSGSRPLLIVFAFPCPSILACLGSGLRIPSSLPELGTDDVRNGPLASLADSTERPKDALVSQSPIVVFKSCNMLQALGIVYTRIVLPSTDVKGETKGKTYCPTTWTYAYQWKYASEYADLLRQLTSMSRMHSERYCTVEQQECQSSKLRIRRISKHSHEWRDGQSHSVFQHL